MEMTSKTDGLDANIFGGVKIAPTLKHAIRQIGFFDSSLPSGHVVKEMHWKKNGYLGCNLSNCLLFDELKQFENDFKQWFKKTFPELPLNEYPVILFPQTLIS